MQSSLVYAVGGCVRDYLLDITPKDYDFCTNATPDEIEWKVKSSGRRAILTGKKFGTIACKVVIDDVVYPIEITTFRSEVYELRNRKPEVKYVKKIEEDLSRRDFTINAIAIRLDKGNLRIIDPYNGREDLKNKVLRCVGNPKIRFKEDPLRILRAIRFATRFDYKIEEKTYKKMQEMAISILDISKERWVMELDKILQDKNVSNGLELLWETKLFNYMIPELSLQYNYDQNSEYHSFKLHEHTIKVVEAIRKETDDLNLLWAGLLHDIAKPFVRIDKIDKYKDIKPQTYPIDGRIMPIKTNYPGHEKLGYEIVKRIALYLKWGNERTKIVSELVLNHLNDDCILRKYDNEGKK